MKGAINYNEKKVDNGSAVVVMASGYGRETDKLDFSEKVNRLQRLADLNTRTETNCLHVSLNFDPSEQLGVERLRAIAKEYMEGIGFGSQPFLAYEHFDAAHQHLHIVTTNIDRNGKRISLHNLGKGKSETARKAIEIKFGLVKAGGKINLEQFTPRPIDIEKANYGKSETKRAISNVIIAVIEQYKFASLAEFNAVLKQYNVLADRGSENSRMFQKRGLQYCIIDREGKAKGVPVKASSIYGRPTLASLELRYQVNKAARQPFKNRLTDCIQKSLINCQDRPAFAIQLERERINVVYRTNKEGFVYGITYVDHLTKSVFNGSELGKAFSAAAIMAKIAPEQKGNVQSKPASNARTKERLKGRLPDIAVDSQRKTSGTKKGMPPLVQPAISRNAAEQLAKIEQVGIIGILLEPTGAIEWLPLALKNRPKKKKKKKIL